MDRAFQRQVKSWFSYGETKLGQGRDAVRGLLLDNPELQDELEAKIKAAIQKENSPEIVEEAEMA